MTGIHGVAGRVTPSRIECVAALGAVSVSIGRDNGSGAGIILVPDRAEKFASLLTEAAQLARDGGSRVKR